MESFGQKIETLRKEKNATSADAARALGIPQSRLRELEKGIRIPTESQVKRMESYFGTSTGGLWELAV